MADAQAELRDLGRRLLEQGEVPTPETLAAAAGISRSTYFRLVGSHRDFLRSLGWNEGESARERILTAAMALIDEDGFAGFSMDATAARADTSRATLYRLFPNKDALLAALARERAPLRPAAEALLRAAEQDPGVFLPLAVQAVIPSLLASRGVLRAMLAEAAIEAPHMAPGREAIAGIYGALMRYMEIQMEAGRIRATNPMAAVQALLGPILLYAVVRPEMWERVDGNPLPPNEVVAELVEIWLRGMRPDPPTDLPR